MARRLRFTQGRTIFLVDRRSGRQPECPEQPFHHKNPGSLGGSLFSRTEQSVGVRSFVCVRSTSRYGQPLRDDLDGHPDSSTTSFGELTGAYAFNRAVRSSSSRVSSVPLDGHSEYS